MTFSVKQWRLDMKRAEADIANSLKWIALIALAIANSIGFWQYMMVVAK